MTSVLSFEMHEEVQPVDNVDRGSPGAGAGPAGSAGPSSPRPATERVVAIAAKVATGALDPKTVRPHSFTKAAGSGRDNVAEHYDPGSTF